MEGKLAHDHNVTGNILHREVHHSVLIIKDAQLQHFFYQPVDVLIRIGILYSQQYQ